VTFDLQHSLLAQGLVVVLALYLALPPLVAAVADAAATLMLARARADEIRLGAARRPHGS
jgi:hypothetical protein